MREIKFNCFYKGKMYPVGSLGMDSQGNKYVTVLMWTDKDGHHFEQSLLKDTPVVQFTGLLDKNGKEIYEGHILKQSLGRRNLIGTMYFNEKEAQFGFDAELESDRNIPEHITVPTKPEIIGTIYENPELLEDNKTAF